MRYSGRWYAVGFDTDRGEERIFRLSRIQGEARRSGRPGSYDIPAGVDIRAMARRLAPDSPNESVTVLVRHDAGGGLRRARGHGRDRRTRPRQRDRAGTGWSCERGGLALADELLAYGADVYVESPPALRDAGGRAALGRRRGSGLMSTTPAPNSAKAQVGRLLTLVPYLHARGSVRVDEAAADLGVSPTQLVSDLKVLFMCGLPGGYPDDLIDVDLDALEGEEGDGVIRVSNVDYLARPLQLSPDRGDRGDRGAPGAAQRRRRRHPRGGRPHPGQAGGRGGRAASTRSSTPARTRWPTPARGTARCSRARCATSARSG